MFAVILELCYKHKINFYNPEHVRCFDVLFGIILTLIIQIKKFVNRQVVPEIKHKGIEVIAVLPKVL